MADNNIAYQKFYSDNIPFYTNLFRQKEPVQQTQGFSSLEPIQDTGGTIVTKGSKTKMRKQGGSQKGAGKRKRRRIKRSGKVRKRVPKKIARKTSRRRRKPKKRKRSLL